MRWGPAVVHTGGWPRLAFAIQKEDFVSKDIQLTEVRESARAFATSPAGSNPILALQQVILMIESVVTEGDSLAAQSGAEEMRRPIIAVLQGLNDGWRDRYATMFDRLADAIERTALTDASPEEVNGAEYAKREIVQVVREAAASRFDSIVQVTAE